MLNIEGLSSEAKVGKILILVSLVIGILVLLFVAGIGAVIYSAGVFSALGISLTIPLFFVGAVAALRIAGLVMGFLALFSTGKKDFSRAGIYAVIASVLPPLDIVMLIGGIFCLVSREANAGKTEETQKDPAFPGR
ncbi:MAG: hypothetical protein QHH04_01315 [Methanolinea sp.]|jgi:hypothetical protein|nr:hypothetical protein [Methanolinea sp.]